MIKHRKGYVYCELCSKYICRHQRRKGLQRRFCDACIENKKIKYRKENRDRIREWARLYKEKNPERIKAYHEKWYAEQKKMHQILLDDLYKNPRKYLDRVRILK
jgi:hypothetical protein